MILNNHGKDYGTISIKKNSNNDDSSSIVAEVESSHGEDSRYHHANAIDNHNNEEGNSSNRNNTNQASAKTSSNCNASSNQLFSTGLVGRFGGVTSTLGGMTSSSSSMLASPSGFGCDHEKHSRNHTSSNPNAERRKKKYSGNGNGVHNTNANPTSASHRTKRLSKSAFELLSQNNPTIFDIIDIDSPSALLNTTALDVDRNSEDKIHSNLPSNDEGEDEGGNGSRSTGHDDMLACLSERILELEQSLKEQQKIMEGMQQNFEEERQQYKDKLLDLESELSTMSEEHNCSRKNQECLISNDKTFTADSGRWEGELTSDQIMRYSRQLLLKDGFGVEGQKIILSSSVLVVGAGGIGSSLLLYLAASGVGNISIVDFDRVDTSNLHRQVIHKDCNAGMNKAVSAMYALKNLNPTIKITPIQQCLTFENALKLVSTHDCIVDASDNPQTRYIVNDACVISKKPLVSGSAMGTEGQLSVYNTMVKSETGQEVSSGCYRCLYPKVNSSEGCKSCSDNGVLGPMVGTIGILQATEVIKVLTGIGSVLHDRLIMYDSLRCSFMSIKKPPRNKNCIVCGDNVTIRTMQDSQILTEKARGPLSNMALYTQRIQIENSLQAKYNISFNDYDFIRKSGTPHVLLDVRVERQYEMCHLEGSINIPLHEVRNQIKKIEALSHSEKPVYCLCRRGLASVEATRILSRVVDSYEDLNSKTDPSRIHSVYNISGGYDSFQIEVDSTFPKY